MMKILSSCGTLLQVTEVQPLCEKVVPFNGREIVLTARARDLSVQPTAIAMGIVQTGSGSFGEEIVVGNLEPGKVIEILNTLGNDEFYDFSRFTYQDFEGKKSFDEGRSDPYTYVIEKMAPGTGFCHENHYEGPVSIPFPPEPISWDQEPDSGNLSWDDVRILHEQENAFPESMVSFIPAQV